MTTVKLEEVLTTEEAAKFLRVSRQTLYKLIEQGRIQGSKVGQGYKFLKSDLIASLRGKTPEPLLAQNREQDSCGVGFVANISGKKSRAILEKGIQAVINLTHRGAIDADAKTGDGAGILTQLPTKLFRKEVEKLGHRPPKEEDLAVGVFFFPRLEFDTHALRSQERSRSIVEEAVSRRGILIYGWRNVPVDTTALGDKAASTRPEIEQLLMGRPETIPPAEFERTLYLVRKEIEKHIWESSIENVYIPSFSSKTIVYKGLFVAPQLRKFYLDLRNPDYETALCLFHQRYSTNTFPNWFLAQPFRMLGHNGEINTLQGNKNWMRAREPELASPLWKEDIETLKPVIWEEGSDSACLDNVMELLVLSGRDLLHSALMLIPEAWQNMPHMNPTIKSFYQYHACLIEPWDGPAALAFSDGRFIGACLDRNGLRPARYTITKDGMIVMASEVGVVEIDDSKVAEKGRLGPGMMIAVDIEKGVFYTNKEIKNTYASRKPYGQWVKEQMIPLERIAPKVPLVPSPSLDRTELLRKQAAFGYTSEELRMVLGPTTQEGKEVTFSMGDDTPLSVLSKKPKLLYTYFKQLFAQVTNPAIDPLRERLVMSLNTIIGARRSSLEETPEHARHLFFQSPLLFNHELEALKKNPDKEFASVVLPALFEVNTGPAGLEKAVRKLCEAASRAVDEGKRILILSDRGVDASHAQIPMLLAVASVHHHLNREGKRMKASLVAETGEAREIHHFALLIGYGVSAFNPYLAFESIQLLIQDGNVERDYETALQNFKTACEQGILKIMSKMGISTIGSYRGAQIFEAVGLSRSLVERCFTGTASRVGGIGMKELAKDILLWHGNAFHSEKPVLDIGGFIKFQREGEYHAFNPEMIKYFHQAVKGSDYEAYKKYSDLVNSRPLTALRDLFTLKSDRSPIPVDEVEPIEAIRKRFTTAGMSHGALSREAHETLAIALNQIGGKSNSGEGGEDPARYKVRENGDWPNSAIKQVASARFGVTPEYLNRCVELEIKIAQGSKPGEGGQLPGGKVSGEIARIRFAQEGTPLISPAPHHDIYSIEDLKQLIYDLKQANPRANVCVKLVAEAGVGTIAAGVAKAHADVILISGHDGGTGASPLSSIKNAGLPWELGVAETQQVLVLNDLRGRVILRTDGGMKNGRDLIVAALLGAEEFNFGTAAVVATGCIMARQCHLNTCPTGVATQDPKLRRERYIGNAQMVVNFFNFVAQEIREILAELGYRTLNEIIGRTDLIGLKPVQDHPKADTLDLSLILAQADPSGKAPRYCIKEGNPFHDEELDSKILQDAKLALDGGGSIRLTYPIRNIHRTVGTRLSGEIAYRYGDNGLPFGTIECYFRGTAGQSFGAFLIRGVRLVLTGEANDYVGKGMGGGEIVIAPPRNASFETHKNVIIGNTVLYGATGGSLFAAGLAGERFGVRNSGATAVVEGTGDHCCEYMTGGIVVILGETGRNFGAGMTGGVAFVYDEKNTLPQNLNPELVAMERLEEPEDFELLKKLIGRHLENTKSRHAQSLLSDFDNAVKRFWKVLPKSRVKKPQAPAAAKA